MEAKNLADLYGLPLVDWQRVEARLAGPEQLAESGGHDNRNWLATTNPDGSPHLTGLWPTVGVWPLLLHDWRGDPQRAEPGEGRPMHAGRHDRRLRPRGGRKRRLVDAPDVVT